MKRNRYNTRLARMWRKVAQSNSRMWPFADDKRHRQGERARRLLESR